MNISLEQAFENLSDKLKVTTHMIESMWQYPRRDQESYEILSQITLIIY